MKNNRGVTVNQFSSQLLVSILMTLATISVVAKTDRVRQAHGDFSDEYIQYRLNSAHSDATGYDPIAEAIRQGETNLKQLEGRLNEFARTAYDCALKDKTGDFNCALAVRKIMACADRPTDWCDGSAVRYDVCSYSCKQMNQNNQSISCSQGVSSCQCSSSPYSGCSCNKRFDQNWQSVSVNPQNCRRPGTLRISQGPCDHLRYHTEQGLKKAEVAKRRRACEEIVNAKNRQYAEKAGVNKNKLPGVLAGDFHGHIEVVALNKEGKKMYSHYADTEYPINDSPRLGHRRKLIACLHPRMFQ